MKKANKMYSLLMAVVLMCMAVLCVHANDIYYEAMSEHDGEHYDFGTVRGEDELEVRASCACHYPVKSTYEGGTCLTCGKTSTYTTVYRCNSCGSGSVSLECGHSFGLKAD